MKIIVHIKDKVFTVSCGEGAQVIRWLGDVAIFRYTDNNAMGIGLHFGMKLENGSIIDIEVPINEVLVDMQHVWIMTSDDLENIAEEKSKGKRTRNTNGRTVAPIMRKKK